MTVKTIRSLARGLQVLEAVAAHQPVGLTALCAATGEDKSALQRTLATLHECGWIQPVPGPAPRWELSARPIVVAGHAGRASSWQERARRLLAPLRDETGETVHLALVDGTTIVVADVADGTHTVRTAVPIGQIHPPETSAAGRAMLAHLDADVRATRSDDPTKLLTPDEFDAVRARGWAASSGAVLEGSSSVASAILDTAGAPVGAVVVSAPTARLDDDRCAEIGARLAVAARSVVAPGS